MSLKFGFADTTGEVKNVNSKTKGIFILGLVLVAAVASTGLLTASAAANGDVTQTRDRAKDCINDPLGDPARDRTQDQLQNQDCTQNCEQNCQQDQAQLQTRCGAGGC